MELTSARLDKRLNLELGTLNLERWTLTLEPRMKTIEGDQFKRRIGVDFSD